MFAITALKMLYWLGRISSMDNFILCGMQFGDEGKGTFVDYLIYNQNIDCIVVLRPLIQLLLHLELFTNLVN